MYVLQNFNALFSGVRVVPFVVLAFSYFVLAFKMENESPYYTPPSTTANEGRILSLCSWCTFTLERV